MRLAIVLCCIALAATFRVGLDRGFPDTVGTGAWGRVLFAVGAAITQTEHGGYGYTTSNVIETVLTYAGLTGDHRILADLGTKFPDNLRNSSLINAAIDKAVRHRWPFNPNEEIRGSGGDDLGLVDYVKLSFYLFGYKLLSLYLTYFLILGISASAFIYTFRSRPSLLALLVITCAAHVFLFSSSIFDPSKLDSIADPRFLSVLAVIPAFHLGGLILVRSCPTTINIALAILQSIILIFAIWTRATAIWAIVAVSMLAVAVTAHGLVTRRFKPRRMWSFGVLLAVWGMHALWTSMALHPIYEQNGEISHHVVWHAIFYQLQHHPQWRQKYAAEYDNAETDELPPVAAKKYLMRHPPRDPQKVYLTEDHKYLKVAASETYIRRAFFEFLRRDPKFVLETYFIYTPIKLFLILGPTHIPTQNPYTGVQLTYRIFGPSDAPQGWYYVGLLRTLNRNSAVEFAMLAIGLFLLARFLATEEIERRLFLRCVLFVTAGFFVSLLPVLPAPDFATVADQYFVLLITLGGWVVLALCAGIRLVNSLGKGTKPDRGVSSMR